MHHEAADWFALNVPLPQDFCFGGIFLPLFSWLIVPVVMPFQVFLEPQFGLLLECRCLNRHQEYA